MQCESMIRGDQRPVDSPRIRCGGHCDADRIGKVGISDLEGKWVDRADGQAAIHMLAV